MEILVRKKSDQAGTEQFTSLVDTAVYTRYVQWCIYTIFRDPYHVGICVYGLTAIGMHLHIVQGFAAGRWLFIRDSHHMPEQKVSRLMLWAFHT